MLDALDHPHAPNLFVASAQSERHRREACVDLGEELSRRLHLQRVLRLNIPLEDRRAVVQRLWLALASTHDNIYREDVVLVDGGFGNLLIRGRLVDDSLVRVNHVLLHLVRQHALHRIALICIRDLRNGLSNISVGRTIFEHTLSELGGGPCGHHHVSLATLRLLGSDEVRVRNHRDVAINVHTEVDLHHVPVGKHDLVLGEQRRVVANAVVDRDARGECHALLDLFAILLVIVNLASEFHDEAIT
mmetsp:Transcript_77258/g.153369  ORF Transcript_77258/g.153369 Transcript_77258/m.153369 type:complete len:246 (-) Transcript_77258:244-981(-)